MNLEEKNYLSIVASIFSIIALLHLARIALGWYAEIGGWVVPYWLSWIALILAGYLAYIGFKLSRK